EAPRAATGGDRRRGAGPAPGARDAARRRAARVGAGGRRGHRERGDAGLRARGDRDAAVLVGGLDAGDRSDGTRTRRRAQRGARVRPRAGGPLRRDGRPASRPL
ncbi:MAG: hypothetical protein AVDCRST_MAG67-4346, partial [uncultured Solirubrobacteraceae bacterium]